MKNNKVLKIILGIGIVCLLQSTVSADAITGTKITSTDKNYTSPKNEWVYYTGGHGWQYESNYQNTGNKWFSNNEDNEVEVGCIVGQKWDLENVYLDNNELSIVGGFNFKNGYDGITGGDVFIDSDGNLGNGYEYVVDMDYVNNSYNVYKINGTTKYVPVSVNINIPESNPFKVVNGQQGQYVTSGSLSFTTLTGGEATTLGLQGDKYGNNTHYEVSGVDLSFLGSEANFSLHYTMSCGNDMIKGTGTTTVQVPEPGTLSLLLMGTFCMFGYWSVRRKKN